MPPPNATHLETYPSIRSKTRKIFYLNTLFAIHTFGFLDSSKTTKGSLLFNCKYAFYFRVSLRCFVFLFITCWFSMEVENNLW